MLCEVYNVGQRSTTVKSHIHDIQYIFFFFGVATSILGTPKR